MNGITGVGARVTTAYGLEAPAAAERTAGRPASAESTAATRPAGADKADALRAVLTDEERAYFDQLAALGPLTYGPGRQRGVVPEGPRGLRLDVTG